MTHLWDVDHPYYFNAPGDSTVFESWSEFIVEFGASDMDYNLVFRWDWKEGDDYDLGTYNGDDYYRHARLVIGFVGQRKGFCWSREVKVCRADEPAIRAFLEPRLAYLKTMWEPLA